jgi:hypothetical protein
MTLNKVPNNIIQYSKIVDLDNMTRPQVKVALDEFLNKGWFLNTIYVEGGVPRAVFIRTKE